MPPFAIVWLACSTPPPAEPPPPAPVVEHTPAPEPATLARPPQEPWNIVLITADTLRGDMLPMNGASPVQTPTLRALHQEGINFRRAYTTFTTTLPAHAGLFASLYARDHGAYDNMGTIDDGVLTLAEQLQGAGYHTAAHINLPWLNPEVSNLSQGFAEVRRAQPIRKADATSRWAVDFLSRQAKAEEPFLLWLHYIDNHTPYYAPGEHEQAYFEAHNTPLNEIWDQLPKGHTNNRHFRRRVRGVESAEYLAGTYKGSVSWLDSQLAPVFDALKESGQWERTVVVFTADHGESLGEHGLWFVHEGLYEPTVRVPLLVRIPGGPQGVDVQAVVSTISVAPTLLAAVGAPPLPDARGDDLWPLISGEDDGADRVAYFEHLEGRLEGVVTAEHKYIRHLKDDDTQPAYPIRAGTEELYALQDDPGEHANRAGQDPTQTAAMARLLETLTPNSAAQSDVSAISPETRAALEAMGYLEEEMPLLSQAPLPVEHP